MSRADSLQDTDFVADQTYIKILDPANYRKINNVMKRVLIVHVKWLVWRGLVDVTAGGVAA